MSVCCDKKVCHSLTAAAMAMDIVSATFNTILPMGVNSDMINILHKVGHKKETNMMRTIQYVSARVDTGGALPTKRKAESTTEKNYVQISHVSGCIKRTSLNVLKIWLHQSWKRIVVFGKLHLCGFDCGRKK